jgi:hypothetical protein
MFRFHSMSMKISQRVEALARCLPPLGAPLAFESASRFSLEQTGRQASRNRWNRVDMASAIGHDPHEGDEISLVWPPPNKHW